MCVPGYFDDGFSSVIAQKHWNWGWHTQCMLWTSLWMEKDVHLVDGRLSAGSCVWVVFKAFY